MRFAMGIFLGFSCFLLSGATVQANPVISVDLDPTSAGIQNTLTASPGSTFTIDIVYTGVGTATFDTLILDVAFNDAGSVLALGTGPTPGAPTAGTLAGTAPILAFDVFGGPVSPGGALTPSLIPIAPGFSGGIGGVGLTSLGVPFPILAAGTTIDIFSLTFTASLLGVSSVSALGSPPGAGLELALAGIPVPTSLASGTVNVTGPVTGTPEPSTLLLLVLGLTGLAVSRGRIAPPA